MGTSCCSDRNSSQKDLPRLHSKLHSRTPSIASAQQEEAADFVGITEEVQTRLNLTSGGLPAEVTSLLDATYERAGSFWWKSRTAVLQQYQIVRLEAEDELYAIGQSVTALYVVRTGLVEKLAADITELGPLEELFVHESLEKDVYSHTATAKEHSEIFCFPLSSFLYPPHILSAAALVLANPHLKWFLENREALEGVERCCFPPGQELECEGPSWVLLLGGGEVEVDGERIRKDTWVGVKPGGRKCTVIEAVSGFKLSTSMMEDTFGGHVVQILWHQEFFQVMRNDPVLSELSTQDMQQCYKVSKFKSLAAGKLLISACKSRGSRVFLVLQGACGGRSGEIWGNEGEVCNLSILSESPCFNFPEDLIALKASVIASIPRRIALKYLSSRVRTALQAKAAREELEKVPLFSGMPHKLLQEIANALTIREYTHGQSVLGKGQVMQIFIVVLSGRVAVMKDGRQHQQLGRYEYAGEGSITNANPPDAVIALGKVLCWEVNFFRMGVYASDVKEELCRRFRTKIFGMRSDQILITAEFLNPMTVKTLAAVTSEEGSERIYGVVIYSLQKDKEAIANEVSVMRELSSPFLLYLHAYFETKIYALVIVRFFRGQQLSDILKDNSEEVTEPLVRIYVACILLGLQSMHVKGIVYLSLCPEHVYIDDEGFPRIIQYRGAQRLGAIHAASIQRHHYSAPEVLEEGRLSPLCDLWGVGIVALECFRCIAKLEPIPFTPPAITDILTKLQGHITSSGLSFLHQLLLEREGRDLTVDKVMAHGWVNKVNWAELRQRKAAGFKLLKPTRMGQGLVRLPQRVLLSDYMRTVLNDRSDIRQIG